MRRIPIGILGLSLWLACGPSATAQQWPQFRGLSAGAVSDDPSLPDTWSETENVAWKIDIPGLSWSSPIVWDDHIFVTTAVSAADDEVQPIPVSTTLASTTGRCRPVASIDGSCMTLTSRPAPCGG